MEVRDNKYSTNNFLKPNKTIIPSMGICHRQQRWNNTIQDTTPTSCDIATGCSLDRVLNLSSF